MATLNPLARALGGIGGASWLIVRAGRGAGATLADGDDLAYRRTARALATYLWAPLPVLALLAALTGLVAGTVAVRLLALYHVERAIEPVLARTLCRDVVPILIGLFASGRVSVDLAARLAGASLAREIDALETLGHDPVRYFLSPALVGVVAAVPVHMLVAGGTALAATGLVIDLAHTTRLATFFHLVAGEATARALAIGTAKALLFALIAFGVGGAVGSRGARGPEEIGARATAAFTAGLLAIFAAAAAWTTLL